MYRSHTLFEFTTGAGASRARKTTLPFLLLSVALALSACAQTGKAVAINAGVKQPKNPAHGVLQPDASADAAAVAPTKPIATMWQSADKLMGLGADELRAALGAPARIRDEEAGRIYQYVGSDCVLDLFLYAETTGIYHVTYLEARTVTAEKKPVDLCLKSLPAPIVADNAPST